MNVTQIHEEKQTLAVDVFLPGHEPRTETALFRHSRDKLLAREHGRCFVCGATAEQSGQPLQAHHHPIERSLAGMIDWQRFQKDCEDGLWGEHARDFDWRKLAHAGPYAFVDDMTVNGRLLCAAHHLGRDQGIHCLPFPLWIAQRYGLEGYRFSASETLHHAEAASESAAPATKASDRG